MALKIYFLLMLVAATGHARLLPTNNTFHGKIVDFIESSGQVVADAFKGLTTIPITVARYLGQTFPFPKLITGNNIDTSKFLADYEAGSDNEDVNLSVGELIVKYGHPLEEHQVVTEDGYVLTMFRIPSNGPVVFLMHGLLGSADDFVVAGPESSLAYLLSEEGYDVWLGNARGNKHSRKHVQYSPSDAKFWDFSWHEIGYSDLPAMIDYVLNTTAQKSLKYVGHSQGTTSFFVMASEKPEYNEKISIMVCLSPVAFMSHAVSPFVRLVSPPGPILYGLAQTIGLNEFLPDTGVTRIFKELLCGTEELADILCSNILFLICGFGFEQLNVTNLPVFLGHIPSGAATKQLIHYSQGVVSAEFKWFNYGIFENQHRYGSLRSPKYNLSNIVAPVALFYSDTDWLANPVDVKELHSKLGNPVDLYQVPTERFNHLDFIWALQFKELIFNRLSQLLKQYS